MLMMDTLSPATVHYIESAHASDAYLTTHKQRGDFFSYLCFSFNLCCEEYVHAAVLNVFRKI